MKRLLSMFAAMFAVALCAVSCETDGDLDDYTPPALSETVSEFAPSITEIIPGYEKLQISWELNNDESTGAEIEKCYVFNGTTIAEINIADLTPENGVYTTCIEMAEGSYDLYMKSLDSDNNLSGAGAKESVFVYGDDYIASLNSHRQVLRSTSTTESIYTTYTLTMSSSWDSSVTGVKVYYIESTNAAEAAAAEYILTVPCEGSSYGEEEYPDYVTCLEFDPEETTYTIPNATIDSDSKDMDIIIETIVAPFGDNVLDPISITAYKTLSDLGTFVEVSSLETLRLYTTAETEYVNVKMTPGVYSFTMDDALNGNFSTTSVTYGTINPVIIAIEGKYNTYDFTGVTIEVGDDVGDYCADVNSTEFRALHITGNYNTVRGLNITDLYELDTTPSRGYTNVIMDGRYNTIEDMTVRSSGSLPYGYGDAFGKGGPYTVAIKKHCSTLMRGDFNTIRRCSLLHKAYGHTHFMQASQGAIIEDCYFEGDVTTSDAILAEAGTGSSADLVDFQTAWGYKLPGGYVFATGEDSIRTYGSGQTYIRTDTYDSYGNEIIERWYSDSGDDTDEDEDENGGTDENATTGTLLDDGTYYMGSQRNTTGPIYAKNTFVTMTRSATALDGISNGTDPDTEVIVTDCIGYGCQRGFSMTGNSTVIRGKATAVFAEAFKMEYNRSNVTADIEVIPYKEDKLVGNGLGVAAHLYGSSNVNVTLTASSDYEYDDFTINTYYQYNADGKLFVSLGGASRNPGGLASTYEPTTEDSQTKWLWKNSTFNNYTDFFVVMFYGSTNNTVNQYGNEDVLIRSTAYSGNVINCYGSGNVITFDDGPSITVNMMEGSTGKHIILPAEENDVFRCAESREAAYERAMAEYPECFE